ncbi:MAG TPA: hypothetical protein VM422_14175 [Amaricoccus sp.]|nr:hypothetical protein [Amaricoccus sp.]
MTTTTFTSSVITDSADPIFSFAADGDVLIVEAGVTLANAGSAVDGRGTNGLHDLAAIIDGRVEAPGWATIDAFGSSIDVTVGTTGWLESDGVAAVEASYDSTVTNNGTFHSDDGFGVIITDATNAAVVNSGYIFGEVGAIEFASSQAGSVVSVTNHGHLETGSGSEDTVSGAGSNQAIYSDADSTTITNDGRIFAGDRVGAGVKVVDGALSLHNSGRIDSSVYIGVVVQGRIGAEIVNDGTISGIKGSLSLSGGADVVTNTGVLEGRVRLGGGNDVFHGEGGHTTRPVWGQAGNDLLVGGDLADGLAGGSGSDTLTGGAGNDTLTGAAGADRLAGGTGDDVFRFAAAGEAAGDRVVASAGAVAFAGAGTNSGDQIDVSAIDAVVAQAGHQQFSFGATHDVGDLWAVDVGDVTHIRGNTGGDAAPELDLAILDGAGTQASDYAALDFIL